ncbi:MAG: hypothetical protein LBG52_09375 [Candidatus Peribacteria bacterium]|jgi:hypothetical protein|nr:hypothetical protein [Candidatus Peribacteria bacterium]
MLSNAWDGVMNAIGAVTKNVANGILATVENMVNRAIDMINRMIEAVNSVSGTIGISFDLIKPINIPKFKDG